MVHRLLRLPLIARASPRISYRPQPIIRSFHGTPYRPVPIIPLPAILLAAVKSGKVASLISLSSKTSLTLLPHSFRRRARVGHGILFKVLAGLPVLGVSFLLTVGLDEAPNTSRLRLIYMNEEEEEELVKEVWVLIDSTHYDYTYPRDHETVVWLQNIVDNLNKVAGDDIRDPVRYYPDEKDQLAEIPNHDHPSHPPSRPLIPKRTFVIDLIADATSPNAMCAGSRIIFFESLLEMLDHDETKVAVILSHEIAHTLQRHIAEQQGVESFAMSIVDIARSVLWMFADALGPFFHQAVHDISSNLVELSTSKPYNRPLEAEADFVGLMIMAKAGYDPRVAIDVWQILARLDGKDENDDDDDETVVEESTVEEAKKFELLEYMDQLQSKWFGSTHPPSKERMVHMRENMEAALRLYEDTLKINGPVIKPVIVEEEPEPEISTLQQIARLFYRGA